MWPAFVDVLSFRVAIFRLVAGAGAGSQRLTGYNEGPKSDELLSSSDMARLTVKMS